MPEPESLPTRVVERAVQRLSQIKQDFETEKPVPFGMRQVSDSEARKQFIEADLDTRRQILAKVPREDLLRILRGHTR